MQRRYRDDEQAKIIARALELQRSEAQGATLAELEVAGHEAGIEPKFLRQAAEELEVSTPVATPNRLTAAHRLGLALVAFAEIYTTSGQVLGSPREFYIPIALALVFGGLSSKLRLLRSLGAYSVVAVIAGIATTLFLVHTGSNPQPFAIAFRQAVTLLLVQLLALCAGHAAANLRSREERSEPDVRTLLIDSAPSQEPTASASELPQR